MTQADGKRGNNWQYLSGDILRMIRTASPPSDCVVPMLESVRASVGAVGACCVFSMEPQSLVLSGVEAESLPSITLLESIIPALTQRWQMNPPLPEAVSWTYPGWVIGKIEVDTNSVGLLCLFFEQASDLSKDASGVLEMLLDGLSIVAMRIYSDARYERLGQNQHEFMRVASHDLRSPLAAIQGFADMLESGAVGELNPKQLYFISKVISGVEQVTLLVNNIQDAGRYDPETGFYKMGRTACDVTEAITNIVKSYLVPKEKQSLTISTKVADNVPIINADVNMIERAIVNLVDNAVKYAPNDCAIEVGARRENESIVIYVKDTGYGISPENQKKIFQRHERVFRREHSRVKGTGLGLFVVRSVALRHGGEAWVESVEGEGSTFFVSIPLNEENSLVGATEGDSDQAKS
jgi:signal transduction histidine kinase